MKATETASERWFKKRSNPLDKASQLLAIHDQGMMVSPKELADALRAVLKHIKNSGGMAA